MKGDLFRHHQFAPEGGDVLVVCQPAHHTLNMWGRDGQTERVTWLYQGQFRRPKAVVIIILLDDNPI